jgi:hypothetical protein
MSAALILVAITIIAKQYNSDGEYGKLAVKYLYNFQTIEELDSNMEALKQIVTDEVYQNLTIDKTDRALNVYLKFKNNPTVVRFEEVTDTYIIYSLETESISSLRKFVFFFKVDKGRISWVREGELIDFDY